MANELMNALDQIEKEKGIPKEKIFEALIAALTTAYKKNFNAPTENVVVNIDRETGEYHVYVQHEVVEDEDFEDDRLHIMIDEAQEIDSNYKVGDKISTEVTPKDFGRIAALTAKQVVFQKLREEERNIVFNEYVDRETEIVTGTVQRISERKRKGNEQDAGGIQNIVHVNLGRAEAILLPNEQSPTDNYKQGSKIKAIILEVKEATKGPQILLSRTHPSFIRRLFELEVPEIKDGVVEIRNISREAGSRTKISVFTTNDKIDPVGACVGSNGMRVQNIVDELNDEKIDIIEWSDDPVEYIANSLRPSKVEKVIYSDADKAALVVVPDDQLSLAIGKEGQNARLAAKLTAWKIDIKSETQFKKAIEDGEIYLGEDFDIEAEFDFI